MKFSQPVKMRKIHWVRRWLGAVLFILLVTAGINYAIDPLWTFSNKNTFNMLQPGFNERQQKTNRALFGGLQEYDYLLLGSSRSTYINQNDFAPWRVYNYASADMHPYEYKGWIEIAQKLKGDSFKGIIIGVDFWATNGRRLKRLEKGNKDPEHYFLMATKPMYRVKNLFSFESLKKSLEALQHRFLQPGTIDYDRGNVKHTIRVGAQRKQRVSQMQKMIYAQDIYGPKYRYDDSLQRRFEALRQRYDHSTFYIFTTPVSKELFRLLQKQNMIKYYKRWLHELVGVFGKVYHFMEINGVTADPRNYPDLHHFYPEVGSMIAETVVTGKPKKGFGVVLTPENIDNYLKNRY